jgi:cytidylate kinase
MFTMDFELLDRARALLSRNPRVFWILGGAGSGKTTICSELARMFSVPVYDMDEHIYGAYFARYEPVRHPANSAWAAADNGLEWLLSMSWAEFDAYNQAAAAEYLDLLAEDIAHADPGVPLLVDGGLYHPGLLARVIPSEHIVCLTASHLNSVAVWTGTDERLAMKEMMRDMSDPDRAWQTFLEFDANITETVAAEAAAIGSPVVSRTSVDEVSNVAAQVAKVLGLG